MKLEDLKGWNTNKWYAANWERGKAKKIPCDVCQRPIQCFAPTLYEPKCLREKYLRSWKLWATLKHATICYRCHSKWIVQNKDLWLALTMMGAFDDED